VIPFAKRRYINRGVATTLVAAGASSLLAAVALIAHPGYVQSSPGTLTPTVGLALVALLTLVATAELARATVGVRVSLGVEEPADDALDDLVAVARAVEAWGRRRVPGLVAATERTFESARLAPVWNAAKLFHLRRHPWRLCALAALSSGVLGAVAHGIAEGAPAGGGLAAGVAAGLLICAIEVTAVVVSFAVLGRFLGIRSHAPGRLPS